MTVVSVAVLGCGDPYGRPAETPTGEPRVAPPSEAWCTVVVDGFGAVDMETDYLPHVITCENGGADFEALKAQAIAARSVAYYNMETEGSICDSQGCQVYSCGVAASNLAHQAVQATAGQYLTYDGMLTYGFYVAGDAFTSAPSCVGSSFDTEVWVTYNEGLSGDDVWQTELGFVGPPGFGQNRGCMSQWGSRCLEEIGYGHLDILRFYYGDDIGIVTAPGECVGGGDGGGDDGGDDGGGDCAFGDGLYCGGNGVDGDAGVLYRCTGGAVAIEEECAFGCEPQPPGFNDACAEGVECPFGDGLYCGGNGIDGNPLRLYRCTGGAGGSIDLVQSCKLGCVRMADGQNDACMGGSSCPFGAGDYCGGNGVGGDPDTLYHCASGTLSKIETCDNGCVAMPAGFDDVCG